MRILIPGYAGFVGSYITEELLNRGHEVWGLDDYSGGNNFPKGGSPDHFLQLDIRNKALLRHVVHRIKPEVLVHLAANAREGASQFQPYDVTSRNLSGYVSVLEECLRYGLKHVVLFSSMAVYGQQSAPFDEIMPCEPVDIYGINKAAMERTTSILASVHGFSYVIFRPHNVFGERQRLDDPYRNVVGIFMNRLMRGEPLYVYGDGEQQRAFSYIENSLPCYIKAVEDFSINLGPVNIGGKKPYTIRELARLVQEAMGMGGEIRYLADRPCEVKEAWCTTKVSEGLYSYQETISVEEGIKRMADWALKQGPKEWKYDNLPLINEKTPETWRTEARV